jgi:hypothetical protein
MLMHVRSSTLLCWWILIAVGRVLVPGDRIRIDNAENDCHEGRVPLMGAVVVSQHHTLPPAGASLVYLHFPFLLSFLSFWCTLSVMKFFWKSDYAWIFFCHAPRQR